MYSRLAGIKQPVLCYGIYTTQRAQDTVYCTLHSAPCRLHKVHYTLQGVVTSILITIHRPPSKQNLHNARSVLHATVCSLVTLLFYGHMTARADHVMLSRDQQPIATANTP